MIHVYLSMIHVSTSAWYMYYVHVHIARPCTSIIVSHTCTYMYMMYMYMYMYIVCCPPTCTGQTNRQRWLPWHCIELYIVDMYLYVYTLCMCQRLHVHMYTIFPQEYFALVYLSTTEWTSTKLTILIIVPMSWHLCLVSQSWCTVHVADVHVHVHVC